MKLLKTKGKENILKQLEKKLHIKETMPADFLSETMVSRRQWDNIFKMQGNK